ncbi:MAG: hypothetical protein ACE3L7_33880 [Candidatus Pristimantibacillus sp.]
MGATMGIIGMFLALLSLIIRKWIVGPDREELWGIGKTVDIWGKIILILMTIIIFFVIFQGNEPESDVIKWFSMIVMMVSTGFQIFIHWKYLESSKEYIVALIVLVVGVILIYFLL